MEDSSSGRGGAPKRQALCYQTQRDIVIPAGTILRQGTTRDRVAAPIGFGPDCGGEIAVPVGLDALASGWFKAVIA